MVKVSPGGSHSLVALASLASLSYTLVSMSCTPHILHPLAPMSPAPLTPVLHSSHPLHPYPWIAPMPYILVSHRSWPCLMSISCTPCAHVLYQCLATLSWPLTPFASSCTHSVLCPSLAYLTPFIPMPCTNHTPNNIWNSSAYMVPLWRPNHKRWISMVFLVVRGCKGSLN